MHIWTPCQSAVFAALSKHTQWPDLLLQSPTGSGKTLAYLLPVLDKLFTHPLASAVVVAPTRELARQIHAVASELVGSEANVGLACGGHMGKAKNINLIIGTPGGLLGLGDVAPSIFVMDEMDRLLDCGFLPQLEQMLWKLPPNCSIAAVSATIPKRSRIIAQRLLREGFVDIAIGGESAVPSLIRQELVEYSPEFFFSALMARIDRHTESSPSADSILIVFPTTRALLFFYGVAKTYRSDAVALHGRMTDEKRKKVMEKINSKKIIIFSTDVLARGIDLPRIGLVVQVGLAGDTDALSQYVHRTGRTGRNSPGVSVLMVGKNLDQNGAVVRELARRMESTKEEGQCVNSHRDGETLSTHPSYKYLRHLSSKCLESLLSWHLERCAKGVRKDIIVKAVIDLVRSTGMPQPTISHRLAQKLKIDHLEGLVLVTR